MSEVPGQLSDQHAEPGELGRQFTALTRSLLHAETVADVLSRVVEVTAAVVRGAALVSVTLRAPDGKFHTPVDTGPLAVELDQVQYECGQGPCLTAADPTGPAFAFSPDLEDDEQWPEFSPRAARHGFRTVFASALVPAASPPQPTGALNVYSQAADGLDAQDREMAFLLATHASLALARTHAVEISELRTQQLRQAVDSRDVIGQAKGILMARRGLSADAAFRLLSKTSQDLNMKLVELARTVTERHGDITPPSEGP